MVPIPSAQPGAVLRVEGRKLVAVVYADMVGYSRLIGLDDVGTFRRLQALRSDLIDSAVAGHGGTLVSTAGGSPLCCTDRGAESQPLFGKRSSAVAGQGCVTPRPPMAAIPAMQSHMAGPHLLP